MVTACWFFALPRLEEISRRRGLNLNIAGTSFPMSLFGVLQVEFELNDGDCNPSIFFEHSLLEFKQDPLAQVKCERTAELLASKLPPSQQLAET